MRDPNRIPLVLDQLRQVWQLSPDMRFGQLLYALVHQAAGNPASFESKLFNMEEDELSRLIKRFEESKQ
jgi:hypothetical protein